MIPTVTQQLEAIKRRLVESVVPELPADAAFAREQTTAINAALDFLIECHEHEYRYAVIEHHDYRSLLAQFAELDGERADLLAEDGPGPDDGARALYSITEQTRRMKDEVERRYARLLCAPSVADRASALLAEVAGRQVEREASWYRGAGFTRDSPEIGGVLDGASNDGIRAGRP